LCRNKRGDSHKPYAWVAVDSSLEKSGEFIVQLAVNHPWPHLKRKPVKGQLRPNPFIKLMKDNVNHNHIGVRAIDSRRIYEIGANSAGAPIPPPLPVIGQEPPKVFE
jgi:hypothetical protein